MCRADPCSGLGKGAWTSFHRAREIFRAHRDELDRIHLNILLAILTNMLRRFVGQQAKALGSKSLNSRSSFPLRSQSASPPFRAISLAASRSFTSPSRRHYSDQPQAKAESETSTNESDTKGETGPLESLRKEVEAKDKEIIDLKVRITTSS